MPLPDTIAARASDRLLASVPGFFDATFAEALAELLQNGRRAGASRVAVIYRPAGDGRATVTIVDDGCGIRDPQVLLSFGDHGWDPQTVAAENPAGMGFAALAAWPGAIASRAQGHPGWCASLDKDHFLGTKKARILPTDKAPAPCGTSVSVMTRESFDQIFHSVRQLGRHFPIPVVLTRYRKGRAAAIHHVEQVPFLQHVSHQEDWGGLRLGVSVYHDAQAFDHPGPTHLGDDLNAFGHTLRAALPTVVETTGRHWKAAAEVSGPNRLQMVLPARRELADTDAARDLRTACYRLLFQAMAAAADPGLALRHPDWQRAADMGFTLPESPPRLRPWSPPPMPRPTRRPDWTPVDTAAPAYVVDGALPRPLACTLARALDLNGLTGAVFEADPESEPCAWYQRLHRITAVAATVTARGDAQPLTPELCQALSARDGGIPRVAACTVALTLRTPGARRRSRRLKTDLVLLDDTVSAVAADHALDADTLAHYLVRAYFETDAYGDRYEQELETFRAAARHDAVSVLQGRNPADKAHAEQTLRQELPWLFAEGQTVRIDITDGVLTFERHP